jgi:putative ABC transport system permease protein
MEDENVGKVVSEWPVSPAQWANLRKERTGMLVSTTAAQRWKLKIGDSFTIVSPGNKKADGTTSWTFKVIGMVGDVDYMTQGYMLGNYEYYDQARPLSEQGKVGQLWIRVSDASKTAELTQRIDNKYANSTTPLQSITEKAAFDVSNSGLDIAAVNRDIARAGMFMVLFLTANGIAQAVRERLAEFATLKTIGFSDTGVIMLVFAEAAVPCLLGAGLGIGLAKIICIVMPLALPPSQGMPIPTMTMMVFVWAAISAAFVAFASSALPALRLRRMDIATALSGR